MNDRLVFKLFYTNNGTMGSGHTMTMNYNTAAGNNDSWINLTETLSFCAEPGCPTAAAWYYYERLMNQD